MDSELALAAEPDSKTKSAPVAMSPEAKAIAIRTRFRMENPFIVAQPRYSTVRKKLEPARYQCDCLDALEAPPMSPRIPWRSGGFVSWLISVLLGCESEARWPPAPPPARNDQKRQAAQEPGKACVRIGDERMAGVVLTAPGRRGRHAGEAVEERQDFAVAGRPTAGEPAAVIIVDHAVGLLAAIADDDYGGRLASSRSSSHREVLPL